MARARNQRGHLPLPEEAGNWRPAVSRLRHARPVGAGLRHRCRGAGGQRHRHHARRARRVHTDARGIARYPELQPGRTADGGIADGIVVTPSHNPPDNGGFKYNPPNGGPADSGVTGWIEGRANELMERGLEGVKRIPNEKALRAATTHRHDYLNAYVRDLGNVIDMEAIQRDRKSTRLNSSHVEISYAVFC